MSGEAAHRRDIVRVGLKFLALAAFSTALYFVDSVAVLALCLGLVALAHFLSGVAMARMLAPLRMLWLVLALIAVAVAVFEGPQAAALVLLRMASLVLAAHLVGETTTTTQMIDTFVHALGPLRPLGVNPDKTGMVLALTIRFVPLLAVMAREVREAQAARGSERNVLALAVPLIVRTLCMADDISAALEARGFDG